MTAWTIVVIMFVAPSGYNVASHQVHSKELCNAMAYQLHQAHKDWTVACVLAPAKREA